MAKRNSGDLNITDLVSGELKNIVSELSIFTSNGDADLIEYLECCCLGEVKDVENKLIENIKKAINERTKLVTIQRSKGYQTRKTFSVSEIGESIGYYMTVCNSLSGCENYIRDLESITLQDIKDAANYYLDMNSYVLSILLPQK